MKKYNVKENTNQFVGQVLKIHKNISESDLNDLKSIYLVDTITMLTIQEQCDSIESILKAVKKLLTKQTSKKLNDEINASLSNNKNTVAMLQKILPSVDFSTVYDNALYYTSLRSIFMLHYENGDSLATNDYVKKTIKMLRRYRETQFVLKSHELRQLCPSLFNSIWPLNMTQQMRSNASKPHIKFISRDYYTITDKMFNETRALAKASEANSQASKKSKRPPKLNISGSDSRTKRELFTSKIVGIDDASLREASLHQNRISKIDMNRVDSQITFALASFLFLFSFIGMIVYVLNRKYCSYGSHKRLKDETRVENAAEALSN